MFIQQIIAGVAMGGIYGLVALGFTLIWNAAAVVNFAQGEFCMISGFLILTFFVNWGWPFPMAFLISILLSGVLGVIVERLAIRPIRGADPLTAIITTLGVSIFLSNSAKFVWGTHPFHFPSVFGDKPMQMAKITLIPQNLWIIGIISALVISLYFFFFGTLTGKVMRAVAQDRQTASLMGISVNRMIGMIFGLSAIMGGLAGILLAPIIYVAADIGLPLVLKAFMGAVIGGFGSLPGALIGGVVIGISENLSAFYISSDYKDVISFAVLIAILIFKPAGLFLRK
ncbi:MAG: branched-chain amino acid ABC transporter permease [Thermodesulfobacteriota bacterium]|jgi:branched-chain amino acid transport system permease protein